MSNNDFFTSHVSFVDLTGQAPRRMDVEPEKVTAGMTGRLVNLNVTPSEYFDALTDGIDDPVTGTGWMAAAVESAVRGAGHGAHMVDLVTDVLTDTTSREPVARVLAEHTLLPPEPCTAMLVSIMQVMDGYRNGRRA